MFSSEKEGEIPKAVKQTLNNVTLNNFAKRKKLDDHEFQHFGKFEHGIGSANHSPNHSHLRVLSSTKIKKYRQKKGLLMKPSLTYFESETKRTLPGQEETRKSKNSSTKADDCQQYIHNETISMSNATESTNDHEKNGENSISNPEYFEYVIGGDVSDGELVNKENAFQNLNSQGIEAGNDLNGRLGNSSQVSNRNVTEGKIIATKGNSVHQRLSGSSTKKSIRDNAGILLVRNLKRDKNNKEVVGVDNHYTKGKSELFSLASNSNKVMKALILLEKLYFSSNFTDGNFSLENESKIRNIKKIKNKSIDFPKVNSIHSQKNDVAINRARKRLSPHQMLLEYFKKEDDLRQNRQHYLQYDQTDSHEKVQGMHVSARNKKLFKTSKSRTSLDSNFQQNSWVRKEENKAKFADKLDIIQGKLRKTGDRKIQFHNVMFKQEEKYSINNNSKYINVMLTKSIQKNNENNVLASSKDKIAMQGYQNAQNTINPQHETMTHKSTSELLPQRYFLHAPLYEHENFGNESKRKLNEEENAETSATKKTSPPETSLKREDVKNMLTKFEQLERNISMNFLETWIYHYRSLDSLGLTPSMLNYGVSHHGSTKRLERAFEKTIEGKDVNLLIVGGSISAGGGIWKDRGNIDGVYQRALRNWWQKVVYPLTNSSLILNEVTVGGTDSEYFSYCVKNYITTMPDIVLWEMAANDYKRYVNRSFDPGAPLEILTRILLALPSKPAVLYINFFRGDYYKSTVGNDCSDSEDEGEQIISDYYNITSLSWRTMVCLNTEARTESIVLDFDSLFSSDDYHPSLLGHAQMAFILITYMRNIMQRVVSRVRDSIISSSSFSLVHANTKPWNAPEPLFSSQRSPDPHCWTLITPNYNLPIVNTLSNLSFTKANRFELTNVTYWPVRLDRLRCLRAQEPGAMLVLKFFVPLQPSNNVDLINDISPGRQIAITTHNRFGGSAELWVDEDEKEKVFVIEPNKGQRRTQVNIIKRHVTSGMHTLTIKAIKSGFCLSAVMLQ